MPKLSEKTLEKRFGYDYCGETLRTRQGLSGHIQFKHEAYFKPETVSEQSTKRIDTKFFLSKQSNFLKWKTTNGLSKSTNDNVARLFVNWRRVRSLINAMGIDLTDEDFKTYLLAGLGKFFS